MLQHLRQLDDPAVTLNLVKHGGILRGGRIDLECALVLLPVLRSLLASSYDTYIIAAIDALSELLDIFGLLIRNTRAIAKDRLGVDLSAEARQQRCQAAFEHFAAVLPRLEQLAAMSAAGPARTPAAALAESLRTRLGMP